jgi:hypothetical protein
MIELEPDDAVLIAGTVAAQDSRAVHVEIVAKGPMGIDFHGVLEIPASEVLPRAPLEALREATAVLRRLDQRMGVPAYPGPEKWASLCAEYEKAKALVAALALTLFEPIAVPSEKS